MGAALALCCLVVVVLLAVCLWQAQQSRLDNNSLLETISKLKETVSTLEEELAECSTVMEKAHRQMLVDQAHVEHAKKIIESHRSLERRLLAQANITEALQREKGDIWKLYRNNVLLAGNAQEIMLREIGKLSGILKKHNIDFKADPVITQVSDNFRQQHTNNYHEPRRSDDGRGDDSPSRAN